jgi:Cyclin, N-terminal domain
MELTVLLLDRICTQYDTEKTTEFPLTVMVCLLLAVKLKGDATLSLPNIRTCLGHTVELADIMNFELFVVEALNYDVEMITPYEGSVILLENFLKGQGDQEKDLSFVLKEIQINILLGMLSVLNSLSGIKYSKGRF